MEHHGALGEHGAQVGAAHPALVTAASRGLHGTKIPPVGTGDGKQLGKEDALADAPVDPDGGRPAHEADPMSIRSAPRHAANRPTPEGKPATRAMAVVGILLI